ncbi:unnamed protein product [Cochlearia groenlandica]
MGDTRGIAEDGNPQTIVGGDHDGCVSITILSPSFEGNLMTTIQLTSVLFTMKIECAECTQDETKIRVFRLTKPPHRSVLVMRTSLRSCFDRGSELDVGGLDHEYDREYLV